MESHEEGAVTVGQPLEMQPGWRPETMRPVVPEEGSAAGEFNLWGQIRLQALGRQRPGAVGEVLEALSRLRGAAAAPADEALARAARDPGEERERAADEAVAAGWAKAAEFEERQVAPRRARSADLTRSILAASEPRRPKDPAERVGYEMRVREARAELAKLEEADRLAEYLRPGADPAVLDAVESAPPVVVQTDRGKRFLPFVDPETLSGARMDRARRADPATAATIDELDELAGLYEVAAATVRQALARRRPGAVPDPVRRAAGRTE